MKYLNKVGRFLVYGNVWVALCAVAQGVLTFHWIGIQTSYAVLAVLFASTFFVYNIRAFTGLKWTVQGTNFSSQEPLQWMAKHSGMLQGLSILALVLSIPFILSFRIETLLMLLCTGLLALAYSFPLISSKGLRQLPGLKTFLIGTVWALSTVLFPVMEAGIHLSFSVLSLLLIKRFLLTFTLALVFDIRDEQADRNDHLHTLVTYLGSERARQLGVGLLWMDWLLSFLWPTPLSYPMILALLVCTLVTSIIVWFSSKIQHAFYFLFVSDGMLMFRFLVISMALN